MFSARTSCPECNRGPVVDLADLLYSPRVNYFRCRACGCWWMVPKEANEPATKSRILLGNPNAPVNTKHEG
jgi:hypothetical protein